MKGFPGSAGVPPAFGWRSRGYLPPFEGGSIEQWLDQGVAARYSGRAARPRSQERMVTVFCETWK